MIVIGYQGVGKSTLAGRDRKFIDLESGNFWVDGKRADDWYKPYCNIAEDLSNQGYIVFTSSHEVVRNRLKNSNECVVVVFPALELKTEWINKLQDRYDRTGLEKDYKALMNAIDLYDENITELKNYCKDTYGVYTLEMTKMNYDLEAAIIHLNNDINRMRNI